MGSGWENTERAELAIVGTCPYLKECKRTGRVDCECMQFTFPDKIAKRQVLYGYCGHPTDWKNCFFKWVMDHYYYERKYSGEKKTVGNKRHT